SGAERKEVYGWLFKSRHKNARDKRIRILLEVEAFLDLHQQWKKLGYPFDPLVPSYATALGSSGDRPAALAEGGFRGEARLVGRTQGEVEVLQAQGRHAHAIVDDDPHQFGQRRRS
ncbi:hypothetical protein ACV339_31220, partial [Pseudomonas aeruginosa]